MRVYFKRNPTCLRFFTSNGNPVYPSGLRRFGATKDSSISKGRVRGLARVGATFAVSRFNWFFLFMRCFPTVGVYHLLVMIIRRLTRSLFINYVTGDIEDEIGPFPNLFFLDRIQGDYFPAIPRYYRMEVKSQFPTVFRLFHRASTAFKGTNVTSHFTVRRCFSPYLISRLLSSQIKDANGSLMTLAVIINASVRGIVIFTIMPTCRLLIVPMAILLLLLFPSRTRILFSLYRRPTT